MQFDRADEGDSGWEDKDPRFRVYFGDEATRTITTQDITEADVFEVIGWAQENAGPNRLYAIALVRDEPD